MVVHMLYFAVVFVTRALPCYRVAIFRRGLNDGWLEFYASTTRVESSLCLLQRQRRAWVAACIGDRHALRPRARRLLALAVLRDLCVLEAGRAWVLGFGIVLGLWVPFFVFPP